jgi:hypothetical protein
MRDEGVDTETPEFDRELLYPGPAVAEDQSLLSPVQS